jgi:hypothetical protein
MLKGPSWHEKLSGKGRRYSMEVIQKNGFEYNYQNGVTFKKIFIHLSINRSAALCWALAASSVS